MKQTLAYFVPSLCSFIPASWKEDGTYSDETWPDDAVEVSNEDAETYWRTTPPDGKMLGTVDGKPGWVDIPLPSADELAAKAERQRSSLRAAADDEIAWRKDAVDAGIATETEAAALQRWTLYRIQLMRVDVSDPVWPEAPAR
ncbi:tail fiber assembly protein [Escherichia coli]|nr:tail fiber assembly protein [Escherichia coli]